MLITEFFYNFKYKARKQKNMKSIHTFGMESGLIVDVNCPFICNLCMKAFLKSWIMAAKEQKALHSVLQLILSLICCNRLWKKSFSCTLSALQLVGCKNQRAPMRLPTQNQELLNWNFSKWLDFSVFFTLLVLHSHQLRSFHSFHTC